MRIRQDTTIVPIKLFKGPNGKIYGTCKCGHPVSENTKMCRGCLRRLNWKEADKDGAR